MIAIGGKARSFFLHSALALSLVIGPPAHAADDIVKGILGALLGGIATANAKKSWETVEPDVRNCLATRNKLDIDKLVNQGIGATDRRVAGAVAICRTQVAAENQRRIQAENERAAREAAEQERVAVKARESAAQAEAQRLADEAAQSEREAKANAARVLQEQKRKEMTVKYGPQIAGAIMTGTVLKGMTREQVAIAKGMPNKKDIVPPSDELWHYGPEQIAFTDGKVTYVGR